jgi:hypothetical protein
LTADSAISEPMAVGPEVVVRVDQTPKKDKMVGPAVALLVVP